MVGVDKTDIAHALKLGELSNGCYTTESFLEPYHRRMNKILGRREREPVPGAVPSVSLEATWTHLHKVNAARSYGRAVVTIYPPVGLSGDEGSEHIHIRVGRSDLSSRCKSSSETTRNHPWAG